MASSLSSILKAMSVSLTDWAELMEPVGGVVSIAADEEQGLDMLAESPKGWRLILWAVSEAPVAGTSDELVATTIRVGLSAARGMSKVPGREVLESRENLPPILDMIEGTISHLRGMHTSVQVPALKSETCFLLRFRGWEWVKFLTGVSHYTARMDFTLPRQIAARSPLRVTL
jgi:hypothetical protein